MYGQDQQSWSFASQDPFHPAAFGSNLGNNFYSGLPYDSPSGPLITTMNGYAPPSRFLSPIFDPSDCRDSGDSNSEIKQASDEINTEKTDGSPLPPLDFFP